MRGWWDTLRIGEWGVQVILLWLVAAVYFGVAGVELRPFAQHLVRVTLWTGLLMAGGYMINDFHDRREDRGKRTRRSLVQRRPWLVYALGLCSLATGMVLIVLSAPTTGIVVVAGIQVAGGLAYSMPGTRLKERGVWGLLAAATLQRIPSFLMFVLAFPRRPLAVAALLAWLLVVGLIFILEHQLLDLRHDRAASVRTWVTERGRLEAQELRHRLYLWLTAATCFAAAAMAIAAPGTRGLRAALLTLGLGGLAHFLLAHRYVGNRSLPRRAEVPRPSVSDETVILGAGLSGLTAAIKLADWGCDVVIRERPRSRPLEERDTTSIHALRFDPAFLEDYLSCPLADCFQPVRREAQYVGRRVRRPRPSHWICMRGSAPDSIDQRLRALAVSRGVRFREAIDRAGPGAVPEASIVATGLDADTYHSLGLDHTRLTGFASTAPTTDSGLLLTYVGRYTHPNYAYVATGWGTAFALIFSRRGIAPDALAEFVERLDATEGLVFGEWRPLRVAVPRECHLFHSGRILAGSLSGLIDPFWYSGVGGGLLSGGIAALARVHPKLASLEHRRATRSFRGQLLLSDLADRLPWPWTLAPWIVNGVIEPAGSIGRWSPSPRASRGDLPADGPMVELEDREGGLRARAVEGDAQA